MKLINLKKTAISGIVLFVILIFNIIPVNAKFSPDMELQNPVLGRNLPAAASGNAPIDSPDNAHQAVFIVNVVTTIYSPVDGAYPNNPGHGTGFFIDPNGLAVTNNHVVAGATQITATVEGYSDPLAVEVIGTDECADLALIQIKGSNFRNYSGR